jgi:hypothetical protein
MVALLQCQRFAIYRNPKSSDVSEVANFRRCCIPMTPSTRYRVGWAVGGWPLEPLAWAGLPGMKWLQPLLPETRSLYGNSLSSIHNPIVVLVIDAFGSICHHLQSLHNPHSLLMTFLRFIG